MSLNTFDLYLFGGTGDLSNRKLIPAMFRQETLSSICTESSIRRKKPVCFRCFYRSIGNQTFEYYTKYC